eukprot:scaffold334306_cov20-Prasinocladus_malaysianus.AAC.1
MSARAVLRRFFKGDRTASDDGRTGVIYIDTENKFSSHRLAEIADGQLRSAGIVDPAVIQQAVQAMQLENIINLQLIPLVHKLEE